MRKLSIALSLVVTLTACGGSSDGGGGALLGPTTHAGFWTLRAVITAIVAGAVNNIDTTTNINIQRNGTVGIVATDTTCALSIFVNGNTLTYRQTCLFQGGSGEGSSNVACTLEMTSVAAIVSTTLGRGTFGPETLVCSGVAASYTGTLVATRDSSTTPPPSPPPPETPPETTTSPETTTP